MNAAGGQIQGRRADQEDAWHIETYGATETLVIVADGLGGHPAGDIASREAVAHVAAQFSMRRKRNTGTPRDWLQDTVLSADGHLRDVAGADRDRLGMATTLIVLYARDGAFWAASVGDSYLLLHRDGKLARLNELHSEGGGVTSCLGFNLTRLDIAERLAIEPHDRFLCASDGLATLDDSEIRGLLAAAPDPATAVRDLLAALEDADQPYQDNATVAVLFA